MSKKLKISAEIQAETAVIKITGNISDWNNSAFDFEAKVTEFVAKGITNLKLYINSGGGSVFQANEIVNILSKFSGTKECEIGALCASAGTYIASCCGIVKMAANGQYMIHKPMTEIFGNEDEIESNLKLLKNLTTHYLKTYAAKTGLTEAAISKLWAKDFWMDAKEALAKGFIDEIINDTPVTDSVMSDIKACGYSLPTIEASLIKPENKNENNMSKEINAVLGIKEDSTTAATMAAIDALKAKAAKADDLQAKLNASVEAALKEKVDAAIKTALELKKITAAQKEYFEKNLRADFEATKAVLDSMPGVAKLSTEITGEKSNIAERAAWTYADWQEKDAKGLQALSTSDEAAFTKLWEAHYGRKMGGK